MSIFPKIWVESGRGDTGVPPLFKNYRKKERKKDKRACVYGEEGMFPGTDDVTKHSVNDTCGTFSNLAKNLHCHLSHIYTYE